MDKRLPFVWRDAQVWQGEQENEVIQITQKFISTEEHRGFSRWERRRGTDASSILILLPGSAFYRGCQTYRSDIRWMWKKLACVEGETRTGQNGYLTLLLTDEYQLYKPQTKVIRGDFVDAALMWSWIKYVTSRSWWKQKQGKLREIFRQDATIPDMLAQITTTLIEEGS